MIALADLAIVTWMGRWVKLALTIQSAGPLTVTDGDEAACRSRGTRVFCLQFLAKSARMALCLQFLAQSATVVLTKQEGKSLGIGTGGRQLCAICTYP